MAPVHLRGQTPASLSALWPDLRIDEALARRVIEHVVGRWSDDLAGVRDLPRAIAHALRARSETSHLELVDRRTSERDGFVKYLFRAQDGALVESVRIPLERPRFSVCVSSQAGCGLGCAFCETGRLGFGRNLEAWEIVEQVLAVRHDAPERPVTGVVFQGQGEPLQNYDAVLRAAAILRDPNGLRIRGESITLSTVGLLPAIERFTEEGHVFRLILSLTSAIQERRERLVPLARVHTVDALARALRRHAMKRGVPVHIGWVLISGYNTGAEEAEALSRLFAGVPVRVHVIDVNDPSGRFAVAGDAERGAFLQALKARGLAFVRRYSGGAEVFGACGMLASRREGGVDSSRTGSRGGAVMGITIRTESDVRILELSGEFALGSGGLAHPLDLKGNRLQDLSDTLRRLLDAGCRRIVLDLEKVPYVDSAGLGQLVACQKRTRQMGGDIRLLRPTGKVRELFELTALNRIFRIFDDERQALGSFEG